MNLVGVVQQLSWGAAEPSLAHERNAKTTLGRERLSGHKTPKPGQP